MTRQLEERTWHRKHGLASWTVETPPGKLSLADAAAAVLETLGRFATPTRVELWTRSRGEDTQVLDAPDVGAIAGVIADLGDVDRVLFRLDLQCLDGSGEAVIRDGGLLSLDLEDGGVIAARLALHVDIYAPKTWGRVRDNLELAVLNGPRLTSFLRAFRERLSARAVDVDVPDYEGAGEDGFGSAS